MQQARKALNRFCDRYSLDHSHSLAKTAAQELLHMWAIEGHIDQDIDVYLSISVVNSTDVDAEKFIIPGHAYRESK